MQQFIRANALKSLAANLVANTVMPTLLLRGVPFVHLKGPTPNLLSVLLPAVIFSVLMTTLVTFGTMTAARKSGLLGPTLAPDTNWLARALREGVGLSLWFALPALALLLGVQAALDQREFSCWSIILASAVVGTGVGVWSSVLAARRAAQVGGFPIAG